MKVVVFTLGCKVNAYESAKLIEGLKTLGFDADDKLGYADLFVINTCAVTAEAARKSRQAISRVRRFNPEAEVMVMGCASEKCADEFLSREGVGVVIGASDKEKMLKIIADKYRDFSVGKAENGNAPFADNRASSPFREARATIKVQDGCDNFCSYCIIPYLRGRSRSRSPESVRKEIEATNPVEAVVTGINLSSYRYGEANLAGLIRSLYGVKSRIRLGSLEERVIDDEFLSACAGLENFAPHFHLSLQSGSDKVLKDMNRRYNGEEYFAATEKIKEYFPSAAITTDIIVGFPTETEEDFKDSLRLSERVGFADVHCFPFSPREGTKAYGMRDLPESVKTARLHELLALKAELKSKFAEKFIGKTLHFIPEEQFGGISEGYSENYLRIYAKCELRSEIIAVKAVEPFRDGLMAEII